MFRSGNDLESAIDQDQLLVYFQPRVEPGTNRLVGAEALVRWEHPEWGLVYPQEFIPFAEKIGVISKFGEKVFDKVCSQVRDWLDGGYPPCKVSVNLSKFQLLDETLCESFERILTKNGISAQQFELEITGEAAVTSDQVGSVLLNLKDMGFLFSIDNFGTDYSTFLHLKSFRFNTIKIDQSFIQDMTEDEYSTEIINAIAQLGQRLGLKVVAEGIEDPKQLRLLEKCKCDEYQGYLFSKPVHNDEFVKKYLAKGYCFPQQLKTEIQNQRKYFRVHFPYHAEANMTIVEIDDKPIKIGTTKILVEDMGAEGLKFLSKIRLPVKKEMILKVEMSFFHDQLVLHGRVVWSREEASEIMAYGLEFIQDEEKRSLLIKLLNKLKVELRKKSVVPGFSFIQTNEHIYFKRLNKVVRG